MNGFLPICSHILRNYSATFFSASLVSLLIVDKLISSLTSLKTLFLKSIYSVTWAVFIYFSWKLMHHRKIITYLRQKRERERERACALGVMGQQEFPEYFSLLAESKVVHSEVEAKSVRRKAFFLWSWLWAGLEWILCVLFIVLLVVLSVIKNICKYSRVTYL